MIGSLPDGFELDDDPARVDLDEVHRFLSTEAYWALGRSRETVERLVQEAQRIVGLYQDGRQSASAVPSRTGSRSSTSRTSTFSRSAAGEGSVSSSFAR